MSFPLKILDEARLHSYRQRTLDRGSLKSPFATLLSPPTQITAPKFESAKWKIILSPVRRLPPEIWLGEADYQGTSVFLDPDQVLYGHNQQPSSTSLLLEQADRWETAQIYVDGFEFLHNFDQDTQGAMRAWDVFSITPKLEKLSFNIAAPSDWFVLPYRQLRKLHAHVKNSHGIDEKYINWLLDSLTLETVERIDFSYSDPLNPFVFKQLPEPLPPLFHLTRLYLHPPTPHLLNALTLPRLQDLKLIQPEGWQTPCLDDCLALLQDSSAASPSSSIPLTKLHIESIAHELDNYPAQVFLHIFQLSGNRITYRLCIPLPPAYMLRRLASTIAGMTPMLPVLEVCIFTTSKRLEQDDLYSLNLFGIARCIDDNFLVNQGTSSLTPIDGVYHLRSWALEGDKENLIHLQSGLNRCCIWNVISSSDIRNHIHDPQCSSSTDQATVGDTPSDESPNIRATMLEFKEMLRDIVNRRAKTPHVRFDVKTDSFSDLYSLLCDVKERLDSTPIDMVKSLYPYFFDMEEALYAVLRNWYDLNQEEILKVHWVFNPYRKKLLYIPMAERESYW
ncbi:hypothetical protein BJ165DRAFT_1534477 [Panaeolus papilionaceus]|nr:hypothetical protein BJ165DRAFT_1534477 [Panaeolus papilionaceus]